MLLQPLEKQLDLPSVMVQFSDHHRTDIQSFVLGEGVREEDKLPLVLLASDDEVCSDGLSIA